MYLKIWCDVRQWKILGTFWGTKHSPSLNLWRIAWQSVCILQSYLATCPWCSWGVNEKQTREGGRSSLAWPQGPGDPGCWPHPHVYALSQLFSIPAYTARYPAQRELKSAAILSDRIRKQSQIQRFTPSPRPKGNNDYWYRIQIQWKLLNRSPGRRK